MRFLKKAEEYYELILKYSSSKLMLYPYHLSDELVGGLRVTPFEYYHKLVEVCDFSLYKRLNVRIKIISDDHERGAQLRLATKFYSCRRRSIIRNRAKSVYRNVFVRFLLFIHVKFRI